MEQLAGHRLGANGKRRISRDDLKAHVEIDLSTVL